MQMIGKVALTASLMALAACSGGAEGEAKRAPSEGGVAATPAQTVVAKEKNVSSKLEDVLKRDMAYADLRKAVFAHGWKPVATPECKKNIGGDAAICDQLPELESCSGDGYCISHFENQAGERLDVTAYGMSEDWNVAGDDSRFNVVEWSFAKASGG